MHGEWREPAGLCCINGRVYLIECVESSVDGSHSGEVGDQAEQQAKRAAGKRVLVLTPQGEVLQVYDCSASLAKDEWLVNVCHCDGMLALETSRAFLLAISGV